MDRSANLVDGIRRTLKARGMTYRDLALALGISEPTVKRDLGRGAFSLTRLDAICDALDVSVSDLLHGGEASRSPVTELSEMQERALIRDRKLLLVTYLLVNEWKLAEITASFAFDENDLVRILLRLDELGTIDYRPPRRIRKLTARNFTWRRDGPVQGFFLAQIAPEFLSGRFDGAGETLHFVGGMLSPVSLQRMKSALAKFVEEFEDAARHDARLPLAERDGCSALLALRRWEYSAFTRLRRKS